VKCTRTILVLTLAMSLAGCFLRDKPQTVKAAPPTPKPVADTAATAPAKNLSTPQTNVELPPFQPVTAEALSPPLQTEEPAATHNTTNKPRSNTTTRIAAQPKPDATPQGPVAPPPAQPESDRKPLQELVPAADQKRLQDEAASSKREIRQRMEQVSARQLNNNEKQTQSRISSFMKESDAAEARGDWKSAAELAERGLALARELTGGK